MLLMDSWKAKPRPQVTLGHAASLWTVGLDGASSVPRKRSVSTAGTYFLVSYVSTAKQSIYFAQFSGPGIAPPLYPVVLFAAPELVASWCL